MFKKIFLICTMIMAMVAVAGCGSSTPKQAASSAQNGKKITIGFSVSTQNNPFFVTMAKSVEEQAKKDGITVKIVDAQNDPAKQANDITDLIESKVDVLLINPVDSAAVSNSVLAANKAKIPVITIDRSSDKGDVVAHIASDNVKGGEMAADFIVKKLGEKANVAELEGLPGASATRERGEGFHKIADQKLTCSS
jgi:ribose transport system substrate-binding protein